MSGDITIRAHCPLCGQSGKQAFWTKYGRDPSIARQPINLGRRPSILTCEVCQFRFTTPVVGDEVVRRYYLKADTSVWPDDPRNVVRRDYRNRILRVCQYAPKPSILEIGCYTGEFLSHFPPGWAKAGIELSESAAELARGRDVEIIGADFFETSIEPGSFGVISAMNIIEHVPDPGAFIRKAIDCLCVGGVLLIETGDVHSRYARFMGEYWGYYHLPEHVSFFSREILVGLMQQYGLEIIESKSNLFFKRPWGFKGWIWHLREVGLAASSAIGWATYKRLANREKGPDVVRYALFKDHMLVVGRKYS